MRKPRLQRAIHSPEWATADRILLQMALGKKGRMHGRGPANGWSPKTNRTVFGAYALGLGCLRDNNLLDWSPTPSQRWSLPVLQSYCDHLDTTYPKGTQRNRLSGLERTISALEPDVNRALFICAISRLGKVHPSVDKERRVQSTTDLEDLGDELMDLADAEGHRSPRLAAAMYRTGLQIGAVADMLNRIGEFIQLQHGSHVYEQDGRWCIKSAVPNSPTKRRPRKRFVPARLAASVQTIH